MAGTRPGPPVGLWAGPVQLSYLMRASLRSSLRSSRNLSISPTTWSPPPLQLPLAYAWYLPVLLFSDTHSLILKVTLEPGVSNVLLW